jgi:hypothetical protein
MIEHTHCCIQETLGVASSLLFHIQDAQRHIVTFNYDFSPKQGIAGRLVAQAGGTNGCFSYRHSGYGGPETFFLWVIPAPRSSGSAWCSRWSGRRKIVAASLNQSERAALGIIREAQVHL